MKYVLFSLVSLARASFSINVNEANCISGVHVDCILVDTDFKGHFPDFVRNLTNADFSLSNSFSAYHPIDVSRSFGNLSHFKVSIAIRSLMSMIQKLDVSKFPEIYDSTFGTEIELLAFLSSVGVAIPHTIIASFFSTLYALHNLPQISELNPFLAQLLQRMSQIMQIFSAYSENYAFEHPSESDIQSASESGESGLHLLNLYISNIPVENADSGCHSLPDETLFIENLMKVSFSLHTYADSIGFYAHGLDVFERIGEYNSLFSILEMVNKFKSTLLENPNCSLKDICDNFFLDTFADNPLLELLDNPKDQTKVESLPPIDSSRQRFSFFDSEAQEEKQCTSSSTSETIRSTRSLNKNTLLDASSLDILNEFLDFDWEYKTMIPDKYICNIQTENLVDRSKIFLKYNFSSRPSIALSPWMCAHTARLARSIDKTARKARLPDRLVIPDFILSDKIDLSGNFELLYELCSKALSEFSQAFHQGQLEIVNETLETLVFAYGKLTDIAISEYSLNMDHLHAPADVSAFFPVVNLKNKIFSVIEDYTLNVQPPWEGLGSDTDISFLNDTKEKNQENSEDEAYIKYHQNTVNELKNMTRKDSTIGSNLEKTQNLKQNIHDIKNDSTSMQNDYDGIRSLDEVVNDDIIYLNNRNVELKKISERILLDNESDIIPSDYHQKQTDQIKINQLNSELKNVRDGKNIKDFSEDSDSQDNEEDNDVFSWDFPNIARRLLSNLDNSKDCFISLLSHVSRSDILTEFSEKTMKLNKGDVLIWEDFIGDQISLLSKSFKTCQSSLIKTHEVFSRAWKYKGLIDLSFLRELYEFLDIELSSTYRNVERPIISDEMRMRAFNHPDHFNLPCTIPNVKKDINDRSFELINKRCAYLVTTALQNNIDLSVVVVWSIASKFFSETTARFLQVSTPFDKEEKGTHNEKLIIEINCIHAMLHSLIGSFYHSSDTTSNDAEVNSKTAVNENQHQFKFSLWDLNTSLYSSLATPEIIVIFQQFLDNSKKNFAIMINSILKANNFSFVDIQKPKCLAKNGNRDTKWPLTFPDGFEFPVAVKVIHSIYSGWSSFLLLTFGRSWNLSSSKRISGESVNEFYFSQLIDRLPNHLNSPVIDRISDVMAHNSYFPDSDGLKDCLWIVFGIRADAEYPFKWERQTTVGPLKPFGRLQSSFLDHLDQSEEVLLLLKDIFDDKGFPTSKEKREKMRKLPYCGIVSHAAELHEKLESMKLEDLSDYIKSFNKGKSKLFERIDQMDELSAPVDMLSKRIQLLRSSFGINIFRFFNLKDLKGSGNDWIPTILAFLEGLNGDVADMLAKFLIRVNFGTQFSILPSPLIETTISTMITFLDKITGDTRIPDITFHKSSMTVASRAFRFGHLISKVNSHISSLMLVHDTIRLPKTLQPSGYDLISFSQGGESLFNQISHLLQRLSDQFFRNLRPRVSVVSAQISLFKSVWESMSSTIKPSKDFIKRSEQVETIRNLLYGGVYEAAPGIKSTFFDKIKNSWYFNYFLPDGDLLEVVRNDVNFARGSFPIFIFRDPSFSACNNDLFDLYNFCLARLSEYSYVNSLRWKSCDKCATKFLDIHTLCSYSLAKFKETCSSFVDNSFLFRLPQLKNKLVFEITSIVSTFELFLKAHNFLLSLAEIWILSNTPIEDADWVLKGLTPQKEGRHLLHCSQHSWERFKQASEMKFVSVSQFYYLMHRTCIKWIIQIANVTVPLENTETVNPWDNLLRLVGARKEAASSFFNPPVSGYDSSLINPGILFGIMVTFLFIVSFSKRQVARRKGKFFVEKSDISLNEDEIYKKRRERWMREENEEENDSFSYVLMDESNAGGANCSSNYDGLSKKQKIIIDNLEFQRAAQRRLEENNKKVIILNERKSKTRKTKTLSLPIAGLHYSSHFANVLNANQVDEDLSTTGNSKMTKTKELKRMKEKRRKQVDHGKRSRFDDFDLGEEQSLLNILQQRQTSNQVLNNNFENANLLPILDLNVNDVIRKHSRSKKKKKQKERETEKKESD